MRLAIGTRSVNRRWCRCTASDISALPSALPCVHRPLVSSHHCQPRARTLLLSQSPTSTAMKLSITRSPRRPSALETTASKLQHIEPELLSMILFILVNDAEDESLVYERLPGKKLSRCATLRATGLVCRSWFYVSQLLLYTHPEPKSFGAIRRLNKTLRKNTTLAERVKSLEPPKFSSWYTEPRKTRWRARRIYLCFSRAPLDISESDYNSMRKLFRATSLLCPNLTEMSLPVSQLERRPGISPEACIGDHQIRNLTTLTLTPLVFPPRMSKVGHNKAYPQITFPRLHTLIIQDLSLFMLEVVVCIQTPRLESLTIDGACGAYSVLKMLIDSVKDTLHSLEVKRILFYREAAVEETLLGLMFDVPEHTQHSIFTDAVYPESLPQGLKHLAVEATAQPKFSDDLLIHDLSYFVPYADTCSSLETLSLMASKASTFVELEYRYGALHTLQLDYYNSGLTSSQDNHTFKMVESLARFVKNKDTLAPQLKTIELRWRYVKTASLGWMICCLAYCLRKRCETYGVEFFLELECRECLPLPVLEFFADAY